MKRFAAIVFALVCTGLSAQTAPTLDSCDDLPCVHLTIGLQTLTLAIDTGDPQSILDAKAASDFGLNVTPYPGPDGKPRDGFGKTKMPITIGSTTIPDVPFIVMPLGALIAQGTSPHVDGTLGYTAFHDRVLTLSQAQDISVSPLLTKETSCDTGHIALLHFGQKGPPIVTSTGFAIDGKQLVMQIDTMFAGGMLIYPTSVDKLGLTAASKSGTTRRFPFTDGGVDMIRGGSTTQTVGKLTLATNAPVYFATPGVHLPDGLFDGTVGWPLLRTHVARFDFHNACFSMQ